MTVCQTALVKYFSWKILEYWNSVFYRSNNWKLMENVEQKKNCWSVCHISGAVFPHCTVHVTRVSFVNGVCQSLLQTDRWTGRLTDNGDANVAGDTPSETLLWLLSQPLVLTHTKRDSFKSPSSFPAMTETFALAQELFISGNVHKTTRDRKMFLELSSSRHSATSVSSAIDAVVSIRARL